MAAQGRRTAGPALRQTLASNILSALPALPSDLLLTDTLPAVCGMPLSRLRVLLLLADGPASVGTLAEKTRTARSNMTTLIRGMCADGLICRGQDDKDKRRVVLQLTDVGLASAACARQAVLERIGQWEEKLSPAEMKRLNAALAVVIRLTGIAAEK